jgi:predicted nucleic acid-binding Zn ribbon protein
MAIAPRNQSRRQGSITLLQPPPPAPAQALGSVLGDLERHWRGEGHLAALWQAWPRIAGPQLAQHCRPLRLQGRRLTVGANHPQWLQALRFNRHQLLGALRAAGFSVQDIQIQQHHAGELPPPGSEQELQTWSQHPSRVDVFGLASCPCCQRPAPAGELQRWGHCSFCQRERMDNGVAMGTASSSTPEDAPQ